jgi:hypothetical protein
LAEYQKWDEMEKAGSEAISRTLSRFTDDLRSILGGGLHEIVIHGSLVLGDFSPGKGDLDYIVATNGNLDSATNEQLFALHDAYRAGTDLLLRQLEGTFYPKRVLMDPGTPFIGCSIGTGRAGWRTITSFQNSAMDLLLAGSRGRRLLGTGLEIRRPSASEIRAEQDADLARLRSALEGPLGASFGFCMSVAHWCGRTLSYLDNREIASKTAGCRWGASTVEDPELQALFGLAEGRRHPYEREDADAAVRTRCVRLLDVVGGRLGAA